MNILHKRVSLDSQDLNWLRAGTFRVGGGGRSQTSLRILAIAIK